MRVPESSRTGHRMSRRALSVALSEARLLGRYVLRTRAVIFWLLAAVAWPVAYVTALGGGGTTPLAAILDLCALPLGPILWSLFGARLSAVQGRELSGAWPAPRGTRSLGAGLMLIAWALLGSATTLASALWGVEPGFWQPPAFALTSLLQGIGMLIPSILLWTAVGFAIGHRTRGIFRSILPPLAPIAMMLGYTFGQDLAQYGRGPLFRLVTTSAAGWFNGVDAFGVGPWAAVFGQAVWVMVAAALCVLALAALSAYGRQAIAGGIAIVCAVTGAGLMGRIGQSAAVIQPHRVSAAAVFWHAAKSPVRVTDMSIALSLRHPPELTATASLAFTVERHLSHLRFFLPTTLHVRTIELDGKSARYARAADGWVTVPMGALRTAGQRGTLAVAYSGAPYILASTGYGGLVEFVSAEGWSLPPGTWYPLLGRPQGGTRFRLRLLAPPGYLSVTPYGVIRGSTGARALTGTGESLQIVGGHLAPLAALGGIQVYAAADQLQGARGVLDQPNGPGQATDRAVAACIGQILRPKPSGAMVWAVSVDGALPPDASPWQAASYAMPPGISGGLGMSGLGGNAPFEYDNSFLSYYPSEEFALWLSDGRSTALPQAGAALQLGSALFTACGSPYTDGFVTLDGVGTEISRLPRPALRAVAEQALRAYAEGRLTERYLSRLVQAERR